MGEERMPTHASAPEQPEPEQHLMEATETAETETTSTEVTAKTVEKLQAKIAELEEQLVQAKAEAEDYRDRWLRVLADYQNYRKRVMQERREAYDEGKKEAVLALLPVLDNMERALASLKEGADLEAYRRGLELIVRLFYDALHKLEVKPIPAEGQKFDPYFHEAFERVEREDLEEGLIVGEVERGYRMGERVIRPAKVRVVVKPAPQLASPEVGGETECTNEV